MNLFEQVALEELSVEGEAMTYNELRHLDFAELSSEEDSEVEVGDGSGGRKLGTGQNQTGQNKSSSYNLPQMIQTQSMEDLNKQFQ
jgi:hypothetical protein